MVQIFDNDWVKVSGWVNSLASHILISLWCGGIRYVSHYTDLPTVTIHPSGDEPITVAEGNDVILRCRATSDGTLNYQWKKVSGSLPNNTIITDIDGGKKITIHNIAVSDSGQYYCEVDNGGANVSSMRVQVTVKRESLIITVSCLRLVTYRNAIDW